jgi:hypothetical protein
METKMTTNPEQSEDTHKAIMEAAKMARLLYEALTDDANALVEEFVQQIEAYEFETKTRKKKRTQKEAANFRQTTCAFVADLLDHSRNMASKGNLYTPCRDDSFHATLATASSFRSMKNAMIALKLIEVSNGFQSEDGKLSGNAETRKACRYRATPTFQLKTVVHGITSENFEDHFRINESKVIPLMLRAEGERNGNKVSKGRRMKIDLTNLKVQEQISRITALNTFLDQTEFSGNLRPRLCRSFGMGDHPDFDWNRGGRLFDLSKGSYQSLSKAERHFITINGEETCEIDFQSSNPTIAYGFLGGAMPPVADLYAHPTIPRDIMKPSLNAILSKGSGLSRMPKDIIDDYTEQHGAPFPKNLTGKIISQEAFKMHPILANLEASGLEWSKLQYLESETMLRALEELMAQGVPALPIHDSVIVPKRHSELAQVILSDCFELVCGIRPNLTVS